MIKKIHQIWIQGIEHFKETQNTFYEYSQLFPAIYPDFECKIWSEKDFLPQMPEEIKSVYLKAPSFSCKADIARMWILYEFGGLYIDTDYEPFKNSSYLLIDADLVVVAMNLSKNRLLFGNYKFSNAWMYSKPKFILFEKLLENVSKKPYDNKKWTAFSYTWEVTGPKAVGDMIEKLNLYEDPKVRILPHSLIEVADFSNCAITSKDKNFILNEYPFAVGIHRMDGSWIKNAHGLKNAFGGFYTWYVNWSDFVGIALAVSLLIILIAFIVFGIHKRKTCKR